MRRCAVNVDDNDVRHVFGEGGREGGVAYVLVVCVRDIRIVHMYAENWWNYRLGVNLFLYA